MLVENAKDFNLKSTLYVQHYEYHDSLVLKNVESTCPIYFYYYSNNG